MQKIKNVDFLRFLGASVIAFEHLVTAQTGMCVSLAGFIPLYSKLIENFNYGWIWLDFFFIISGFFLFYATDFKIDFITFVKKKIIRLVPVIAFLILIYWILSLFHIMGYIKFSNIYAILLINCIGITTYTGFGNIGATWFVSSLFWVLCFYFYLKKLVNEKCFSFITALLVFFSYVFFVNKGGHCSVVHYGFINVGILKAIGGIGLGYFLSVLWKDYILKEHNTTIIKKLIYTFFEAYLLWFLIYNTTLHKIDFANCTIFILAFLGLFWLFITKQGYITRLLDNNISVFLGKYSYSIYVTHTLILNLNKCKIIDKYFSPPPPGGLSVVKSSDYKLINSIFGNDYFRHNNLSLN